ncbi:MAG: alpha-ribazole phosphatase [Methylococcales bacterium]|nr:alpha-ribazole phosphatase [Methylococcales bacterium]
MEIYLIRHTKTVAQTGLCYGRTDLEVGDDFLAEAKKIKTKLPEFENSCVIYSSPLQRCQKLASYFGNANLIDERLQELDFGDWENCLFDDLPSEDVANWTENFVTCSPPNGESFSNLVQRVDEFWQMLLSQNTQTVFIVTHAGVIRALLAIILQLPLKNAFQFQVDYGSVHKLRYVDGYTYVAYLNH